MKISGMNPEEELPPEVEHRAYYKQPVWKRIVVIGAGPGGQHRARLRDPLLRSRLAAPTGPARRSDEVVPKSPAAGVLQAGRPDRRRRREGVTRRRRRRAPRTLSGRRRRRHQCAGKPTRRLPGGHPRDVDGQREGRPQTITVVPNYDASRGANSDRLLIRHRCLSDPASAARSIAPPASVWLVTTGTVQVFSHIFESEAAQADLRHRRRQRCRPPGDRLRSQAGAARCLALVSLSLGLINLLPILPLDGGHIFWSLVEKLRGRAGFVAGDGAGDRGRLRCWSRC